MDPSNGSAAPTVKTVTARELLERYYDGHIEDVERILRFASAHGLDDNDMVFLLSSILTTNENLIRLLLEALVAAEQTLQNAELRINRLVKHTEQVMVGQVEQATSRATGQLNAAADRFSGSMTAAEALGAGLVRSGRDVRLARDTLQRMMDLHDGAPAIDRLWGQVGAEAREYLRMHGTAVVDEIRAEVRVGAWVRHSYGVVQLLLAVLLIIVLLRR